MIYFKLFFEFAKIGLFNFGGGMASIPFLRDLSVRTGWYTLEQLTDFIAISESTPGPMAVNVATYAGFSTAGILGGVIATFGLIFPAFFVMTLIAKFLDKFKGNKYVDWAFYGLRPCVLALIASSLLSLMQVTMLNLDVTLFNLYEIINIRALGIFILIFALLNYKPLKKVHPVAFLALSAIIGIIVY